MKPLLFLAAALALAGAVSAGEPFLKPNDVIAFVGGEDMVAASEYGYLELLLIRALPEHHLRFRNLAWEGDTVFEQRRDLNFPPLEDQLEKVGATVVIAQFGQMESLAGKEKVPEFEEAYEKLIERLAGGAKRRLGLLAPSPLEFIPAALTREEASEFFDGRIEALFGYEERAKNWVTRDSIRLLGVTANSLRFLDARTEFAALRFNETQRVLDGRNSDAAEWVKIRHLLTRDGVHLSDKGHRAFAVGLTRRLLYMPVTEFDPLSAEPLRQLIRAKNRLWSYYWRPQNWAFLAGDRTNQPSSRDHLDRSKRWFPDEIEQFILLIEAKEREIDALAAQLARP